MEDVQLCIVLPCKINGKLARKVASFVTSNGRMAGYRDVFAVLIQVFGCVGFDGTFIIAMIV